MNKETDRYPEMLFLFSEQRSVLIVILMII